MKWFFASSARKRLCIYKRFWQICLLDPSFGFLLLQRHVFLLQRDIFLLQHGIFFLELSFRTLRASRFCLTRAWYVLVLIFYINSSFCSSSLNAPEHYSLSSCFQPAYDVCWWLCLFLKLVCRWKIAQFYLSISNSEQKKKREGVVQVGQLTQLRYRLLCRSTCFISTALWANSFLSSLCSCSGGISQIGIRHRCDVCSF